MKNLALMLVLVLSCGIASADVIPGTLYRSDAQLVDEFMEAAGVYGGRVKILEFECLTIYAIEFPEKYFSWDSEDDMNDVWTFFVAVAQVSEKATWHSDAAIVLYEDDTLGIFTVNCMAAVLLREQGYDIEEFLSVNIRVGDRATSQLRL